MKKLNGVNYDIPRARVLFMFMDRTRRNKALPSQKICT
ncbi:unnamed protein product, partial [Brassica oleracea]